MGQLPDCMALEMVSPAMKYGQPARVYQPPSELGTRDDYVGGISVSEDRVLFSALTALGDTPTFVRVSGDPYVASREGAQGKWTTSGVSPGGVLAHGPANEAHASGFGPDYGSWFQWAAARVPYFTDGWSQVLYGSLGNPDEEVTSVLASLGSTGQLPNLLVKDGFARGASGDHSRFYFTPGNVFTPGDVQAEAAEPTFYLPGDPRPAGNVGPNPGLSPPFADATFGNTYVARRGSAAPGIELLARDSSGKVWGGNCGATVAGSDSVANGSSRGAIAHDGSRVYFMARPDQPFDSDLGEGPACDKALNKARIMVREESQGGPEISELFEPECDRTADLPAVPACGAAGPAGSPLPDGDDDYVGGSVDGSRVYLVTSRQLADSDVNGLDQFGSASTCAAAFAGGCDLYLYDRTRPPGESLVQVTASGLGQAKPRVHQVSGDGSHVYFSSTEVLTGDTGPEGGAGGTAQAGQQNLYVFDADEERLSFIGIGLVGNSWPIPVYGPDLADPEAGGSGHTLVFTSDQSFTADDIDGGRDDVFRYDSRTHRIDRVSKGVAGGSDNGPHDTVTSGGMGKGEGSNTGFNDPAIPDIGTRSRWVSEDGATIAFRTSEGLIASDNDGTADSYVWRSGQLAVIPGTTDEFRGLDDRPLVSLTGGMVVFQSFAPLLPQDGDTAIDVYALRVDGGFDPPPPPPDECDARAGGCQGGGADRVSADPRTSSTPGGGDAAQPPRKQLAIGGLSARSRRIAARRGVLAVRVRSNRAGSMRLTARARVGGRVWQAGSAAKRLTHAGATTIRLRLDQAATRALRQGRRLDLSIAVRSPGARARAIAVALRRPQS